MTIPSLSSHSSAGAVMCVYTNTSRSQSDFRTDISIPHPISLISFFFFPLTLRNSVFLYFLDRLERLNSFTYFSFPSRTVSKIKCPPFSRLVCVKIVWSRHTNAERVWWVVWVRLWSIVKKTRGGFEFPLLVFLWLLLLLLLLFSGSVKEAFYPSDVAVFIVYWLLFICIWFSFLNSPFLFLYSLSVYSAAGLRTDNKTKRVFPFLFRILSPSSRERKEKSRSCLNCLVQSCGAHGPGPLSLLLTSLPTKTP